LVKRVVYLAILLMAVTFSFVPYNIYEGTVQYVPSGPVEMKYRRGVGLPFGVSIQYRPVEPPTYPPSFPIPEAYIDVFTFPAVYVCDLESGVLSGLLTSRLLAVRVLAVLLNVLVFMGIVYAVTKIAIAPKTKKGS
jgi:hypothetical protein